MSLLFWFVSHFDWVWVKCFALIFGGRSIYARVDHLVVVIVFLYLAVYGSLGILDFQYSPANTIWTLRWNTRNISHPYNPLFWYLLISAVPLKCIYTFSLFRKKRAAPGGEWKKAQSLQMHNTNRMCRTLICEAHSIEKAQKTCMKQREFKSHSVNLRIHHETRRTGMK